MTRSIGAVLVCLMSFAERATLAAQDSTGTRAEVRLGLAAGTDLRHINQPNSNTFADLFLVGSMDWRRASSGFGVRVEALFARPSQFQGEPFDGALCASCRWDNETSHFGFGAIGSYEFRRER